MRVQVLAIGQRITNLGTHFVRKTQAQRQFDALRKRCGNIAIGIALWPLDARACAQSGLYQIAQVVAKPIHQQTEPRRRVHFDSQIQTLRGLGL